MNSKVSVIIPNYNHATYLPRRIDSVLNQTFTDFEVIILDDCSTDNSEEIISEYANNDPRITTIYNSTNSGSTFKQWKKGIDLAKGELIWIAESDDFAEITLLAELVSVMDKCEKVGVAYCQSNFVNEKGEIFGNHFENLQHLDSELWKTNFCIEGKKALTEFMPIINIIPNASAVIFRKKMATNMNWETLYSFTLAGDRYFWINLLKSSDLGFVAKALNFFRFSDSTVRTKTHLEFTYLMEIRSIFILLLSLGRIPIKQKGKAIRQWLRQCRKVVNAGNKTNVLLIIKGLIVFLQIIGIGIVGHKIVSKFVVKTVKKK